MRAITSECWFWIVLNGYWPSSDAAAERADILVAGSFYNWTIIRARLPEEIIHS